jgi:hypothetical protein
VLQVLRWQSHRFDGDGGGGYGGGFGALAGPDSKQQIKLTVADESWEAAAMAVLAVLYLLQPAAELLGELTQEQQVQAAVLGDMWDVPAAASAAVVHLAAAADGSDSEGLSAAALDRLVGMSAVPACLQSVLRSALLVKFGDLEATWSDAELRKELLQLPLSVMELLLSSDKLKVGRVGWRQ